MNIEQTARTFSLSGLAAAMVLLFQTHAMAQRSQSTTPGQSEFSAQRRVEYIAGDLPVIISVPHGGGLAPDTIPDRSYGTKLTDGKTEVIAREIVREFLKHTGHYPHVIICHLKRSKVDCNRPIKEAAQGNEEARQVWENFHAMIEKAQRRVVESNGGGLYVDLHGHSHPAAHLELGYLLNNSQLKNPDKDLAALQESSSLRSLKKPTETSFLEVLKGKTSFGGLMQQRGFPSVPSPEHPDAGAGKFFSGGYNTLRYCLQPDGKLFGFQLECPNKGVRDSATNRKIFARAFVSAVVEYLKIHAPH